MGEWLPISFQPSGSFVLRTYQAKEGHLRMRWRMVSGQCFCFFRPTDCYSCITYAEQLEDELQLRDRNTVQIAAVAVDTNADELRSFLESFAFSYPVFVAPASAESKSFYQALDRIAPTPLLVLAQGQRVRYATRLLPDDDVMEMRYSNLLTYLPREAK